MKSDVYTENLGDFGIRERRMLAELLQQLQEVLDRLEATIDRLPDTQANAQWEHETVDTFNAARAVLNKVKGQ